MPMFQLDNACVSCAIQDVEGQTGMLHCVVELHNEP